MLMLDKNNFIFEFEGDLPQEIESSICNFFYDYELSLLKNKINIIKKLELCILRTNKKYIIFENNSYILYITVETNFEFHSNNMVGYTKIFIRCLSTINKRETIFSTTIKIISNKIITKIKEYQNKYDYTFICEILKKYQPNIYNMNTNIIHNIAYQDLL